MDLLSGGDDYELIFTVPFKHISKVNELSEKYNVQIKQIGKIIGKGLNEDVITLKDVNGKILKISSEGYQHFRN
jgi:thiamine-monophosphate kinase